MFSKHEAYRMADKYTRVDSMAENQFLLSSELMAVSLLASYF